MDEEWKGQRAEGVDLSSSSVYWILTFFFDLDSPSGLSSDVHQLKESKVAYGKISKMVFTNLSQSI